MDIRRIGFLYAIGSFGGMLTVVAFWLIAQALVEIPFVSFKPELADFYPPMIWGGVSAAVLYTLPLYWNPLIRGALFSLLPAFIELAHRYGWMPPNAGDVDLNLLFLQRESLLVIVIYIVFWGFVTAKLSGGGRGGGRRRRMD